MRRLGTVLLLIAVSAPAFCQTVAPPPSGFRGMVLGSPIDDVKRELEADTNFAYRGDPDVSLLPLDGRQIIETEGRRFVEWAFFQFFEDRLYTITIRLRRSELDFYTMYTSLTEKYGEPTSLSPDEVVWLSDEVRFSLEKPLTVRYVDQVVFNRRLSEQQEGESMDEFARDQFVEQF